MATFQPSRRPLGNRSIQQAHGTYLSPAKQHRTVSGSKRPRSPDRQDGSLSHVPKRVRATPGPSTQVLRGPPKERKSVSVREQQEAEFKDKYTRAFPSWKFYFDSVDINSTVLQSFTTKILSLGGKVEHFFDNNISHLITDIPISTSLKPDKENHPSSKPISKAISALKSPIKLVGRTTEAPLVSRAVEYNIKIWTTSKLDSVLSRCLESPPIKTGVTNRLPGRASAPQRSLSHLLQTEKIHGTSERDPTQKRHDYHYFTRGSCFVLLEDMHQQLATIAAHEYPVLKDKDKSSKRPWPVLHCHPLARNPFIPFDEKERKRYERAQQLEKEGDFKHHPHKKELEIMRKKEVEPHRANAGADNLRRAVSMSNMKRRLSHPVGSKHDGPCIDLNDDGDDVDSAKASGYLASGAETAYLAASGNSVSITSTTGTTSTSGQILRRTSLPHALTVQMKQQIRTSRKLTLKDKDENFDRQELMGPPSKIPNRLPLLKKSKSTNTLRLPKREEGAKPGYCESCRAKFSDFSNHTESSKHRKFASNPANFQALDEVLGRIRRRTREEVQRVKAQDTVDLFHRCKRDRHFRPDNAGRNYDFSSP